MKVGILFNEKKQNSVAVVKKILELLVVDRHKVFLLRKFSSEFLMYENAVSFLEHEADFLDFCKILIIVGGDGTFLYYSKLAAECSVPVLTVNNGRKGYLSTLEIDDLNLLKRLTDKKSHVVEEKILLETRISGCNDVFLALNEVVVARDVVSKILDFRVSRFNEKIYDFRADGVIVSTSCGSSAYNLSCGGSLLHKNSNSVIITPVSTMDFSARPTVFSDNDVFEISCTAKEGSQILVICDGINKFATNAQKLSVTVKKSKKVAKFLHIL